MSGKGRLILSALLIATNTFVKAQLGAVETNVPWRAGHASVYESPYVIVYGGSQDPNGNYSNSQLPGAVELWAWDTRNGSWFHPTLQGGNNMLGQLDFKATTLPSSGQLLAVVANTTGGTSTGVLQKLDTNSWSWSFPTSNYQASARTVGHSLLTINNTVYKYGGISVDSNGFATSGGIQNTLALMDASSFQWTSGANGMGLTDHSTCYLKACNCLVTFGGTSTGSATDVTDTVITYDLTSSVWNVQGLTTAQTVTPGARRLHTANCLDDMMIVYGGGTTTPFDSDVWILNATAYPTLNWQRMTVANQSNGPNLRMGHSSVLDEANKKLYIYGGWGMSSTDNNMYVLDINNWSWTRVAPTGYPADAMPSLTPSTPGNQDTSHSKASTGTIAGAAVGGAIGTLIIIAVIAFFIIKRKRRARSSKETITQDVDENMNDLQKDDNPFYYSGGGYYSTRDDKQHDQLNHSSSSSSNALYRKGFGLNGGSTQTSLAKRSEIGDSDKVVTGVLEALPSEYAGTAAATLGSRSPRESFRNSKVLLSPVECSQGQVPNEITSQKPNEFSIPAARFQNSNNTPIDHHYQQQPDSMEVLTSMTTNASSVMNNIGGKIRSVPVTHSTVDQDDNWPDSTSVTHQNTPIQYILPNSNQIGSTTSTQTWDTKHLVTHHQYPSSTLNMPIAQAVTPPTTKSSTRTTLDARQPNIYNSTSPLDALASLGMSQENLNSSSSTTSAPLSSTHDAAPSSASSSNTSSTTQHQRFKTLAPLIAMLPRRYKVDERQSPIIGPSNSILFATNNQERPVAIKSFGRREAWERECRTLIKLKSPCIVEILEVLTIQHEQNNDQVKYVTVMERLDQNLHYYLKRNSNHGSIARDILKCLEWCHGNGIAFCDLKPSNIMYDTEQCKLIDFEASRTIDEECVGVITPRYCPPEVARATTYGLEGANGVVATASVDLWSLGCVLFELETKKALFSNNMKDETILHFISHPSPSTPILNNGLRWNNDKELEIPQLEKLIPNPSTRQLIKSLLSRDPAKRGSSTQLLSHPYFL